MIQYRFLFKFIFIYLSTNKTAIIGNTSKNQQNQKENTQNCVEIRPYTF